MPEDPDELIGSSVAYTVSIKEIKDIPETFCKSVYIDYESFYNKVINTTKTYGVEEKETNYEINETFEHNIEYITKEDINFIKNENVYFNNINVLDYF